LDCAIENRGADVPVIMVEVVKSIEARFSRNDSRKDVGKTLWIRA
jgi:hypothetical protein